MTSCVVELTKSVIRDNLGFPPDHPINMEDEIVGTLGADSLDVVEIVMMLEDAFEIEAKDEDAEKCVTVQDAVDLIHTLLKTPQPEPKPVTVSAGSRFDWEGDTWEIIAHGPASTLVKKVGTEFLLNVETYKIEFAVEQHNKEQA